jgi:hypothetical protein
MMIADLGHSDLSPAGLDLADIGSADLGSADLGYSVLGPVDLGLADQSHDDLVPAHLRLTDQYIADLGPADIGPAEMCPADLNLTDLGLPGLSPAGPDLLILDPSVLAFPTSSNTQPNTDELGSVVCRPHFTMKYFVFFFYQCCGTGAAMNASFGEAGVITQCGSGSDGFGSKRDVQHG